jgi:isoamyl acetate esterase
VYYIFGFDMNIQFCLLKCSDGLHLTNGGNQLVFEEVIRKLSDEGLTLESMAVDLPLIGDIDPNDPLKAFL